jgi:hypothetical protein
VDESSERYHSTGCRCRFCWTLREFMLEETGKSYGLPRAEGHAQEPSTVERPTCSSMTCVCPKCASERAQMRPTVARQPWEIRRRSRAA